MSHYLSFFTWGVTQRSTLSAQDAPRTLKERYAPFFAAGEEGTGTVQTEAEYLQSLRRGNIFGGEMELQAIAAQLERPVVVCNVLPREEGMRGQDVMVSAYCRPGAQDQEPLLILRRAYHYDALVALPRLKTTMIRSHSEDSLPWRR